MYTYILVELTNLFLGCENANSIMDGIKLETFSG